MYAKQPNVLHHHHRAIVIGQRYRVYVCVDYNDQLIRTLTHSCSHSAHLSTTLQFDRFKLILLFYSANIFFVECFFSLLFSLVIVELNLINVGKQRNMDISIWIELK